MVAKLKCMIKNESGSRFSLFLQEVSNVIPITDWVSDCWKNELVMFGSLSIGLVTWTCIAHFKGDQFYVIYNYQAPVKSF